MAPFSVWLSCISMHSVFWLFLLSCQYLPSDWLERLLWGRLIVARGSSPKTQAEEYLWFSWFNILFYCSIVYLSCPPALHSIYFILVWQDIVCAESAIKHQSIKLSSTNSRAVCGSQCTMVKMCCCLQLEKVNLKSWDIPCMSKMALPSVLNVY